MTGPALDTTGAPATAREPGAVNLTDSPGLVRRVGQQNWMVDVRKMSPRTHAVRQVHADAASNWDDIALSSQSRSLYFLPSARLGSFPT
jgi:hypothetical protein